MDGVKAWIKGVAAKTVSRVKMSPIKVTLSVVSVIGLGTTMIFLAHFTPSQPNSTLSFRVSGNSSSKLVVTGPSRVYAGKCSRAFRVASKAKKNAKGKAMKVALFTTNSGEIFKDPGCVIPLSSVLHVPGTRGTANFYFRGNNDESAKIALRVVSSK